MTPPHVGRRSRTRTALTGFAVAAVAAAFPAHATADVATARSEVSAAPMTAAAAPTVTLLTGQKVTVAPDGSGRASYLLRPAGAGDDGVVSWQPPAGDHYVVPVDALPYLGKGLDRSLFDVTALAARAGAGSARTPVTLAFASGISPTAPPGVTLTSVAGATGEGYVTPQSSGELAAALRARIGADVAAGRAPGSTPLVDGLTGMSATGAAAGVITPKYPLQIMQIDATGADGAPADALAVVMDNDSLARENAEVPVVGGLGRVAVPAGNYSVATFFPSFDDEGDMTEMRAVSPLDVTVPASGGPTHVALDARTATSTLKVSTPKATNLEVQALDVVRVDATGLAASDVGLVSWSTSPILVAPQPKPTVGRVQLRTRFDAVAAVPSDNYRYDLAFSSDHIDADQTYAAEAGKLATVHHRFFSDPAGQPTGSLLAGPADPSGLTSTDELSGFTTEPMPGQSTEYVETFPGSLWSESFGNFDVTVYAEPRSFAAGGDYDVDWLHGPLAPTLGQHSGLAGSECDMCVAGPVTTLAYEPTGDSAPDQFGYSPRSLHVTGYVNGRSAVDADNAYGMVVDAASAGAATYRLVLTTDSTGSSEVTQTTHTVTDLTVKSPAAPDPDSALPAMRTCEGESADTPCQILPALSLDHDLATDLTNTSHAAVQTMNLTVGHISYGGKGSTAPICTAAVAVSFDGGSTWVPASMTGTRGHYVAVWSNPASPAGVAPMLKVTATDTLGGSITQTITNAYTVAPATSAKH